MEKAKSMKKIQASGAPWRRSWRSTGPDAADCGGMDQPVHLALAVDVERPDAQELDAARRGADAAAEDGQAHEDEARRGEARPGVGDVPVDAREAGVERNEAAVKRLPQSASAPAITSRPSPCSMAPTQWRMKRSAATERMMAAASRSSASRGTDRQPSGRSSRTKVTREKAKTRNRRISASPATPDCAPSSPPTGEIPLVESVAMAWQSATSGVSPAMTSPPQSASVRPP